MERERVKRKMDNFQSRRSRERESSPDRAKVSTKIQQQNVKPIKKVQVVYYLSRNGHLEHPHYMEVTLLPNQHLRLRDVKDRLIDLRGKGMPSLYSWSCKRSYKNGYVWNDLADNDIIYQSDGAEYVLKGSELVERCTEKFQELQVTNNRQIIQEPSLQAKGKQLSPSPLKQLEETRSAKVEYGEFIHEEEEESQEEFEDEEKTSYTSSTTPHSRSKGVSTDELEDQPRNRNPTTESTHHNPSSLPFVKTDNAPSKRFEGGDPVSPESATTRNSVLLQLISCGNLIVAKSKNNGPSLKQQQQPKVTGNSVMKRSESNLHKGILYKTAIKVAEEDVIIRYMSENPRFGNLQAEDKEYFSGSIVESMSKNRVEAESAGLKRSNSYNEERSRKAEMEEAVREDIKEKAAKGKCIPRKVLSSSKQIKIIF